MARRPLLATLLPAPIVQVFLAALLGFSVVGQAQQPPVREQPAPMEFLGSQDDNLFSLSRSQEDIHEWELALAEASAGEFAAAVERLHKLLRTEIGGVVPVAPGRFLGLRLAVITTLANLPAAGMEAYETLVRREAGNFADRPLEQLDQDQLLLLAQRFPTASLGQRARQRLGDLALEAGRGTEASNHYRLALDGSPIGSSLEQKLAIRLLCANVCSQPRTARVSAAAGRLPTPGQEVLSVLPPSGDPTAYAAAGGGEDGRTPMEEPAGKPAPAWSEDIAAPGFDGRPDRGSFAMFPVGDLDGIYVNTGQEVVAFDPLRRSIAWVTASPMREFSKNSYRYLADYEETINQDMVLAAACGDDVVIAALQVPENSKTVDFQNNFRIINKIPQRRLFAFSRTTGQKLWAHYDELDGPKTRRFRGHDACGPPLVVGDTVYAPMHDRAGAIAFSVGAYDLHTGALKWRRLVCSSQQEVNMFGNVRAEFAASPLAVADGVLYGAANLGIVYALELATGRVRWIAAHEVVKMPMTRMHSQQERSVYFANNAPVIADGVVCCTPLDSQFVLGLDAESGRLLWRVPADAPVDRIENNVRWLAGAIDDEFVLVGRGAIAIKARPKDLLASLGEVRQLVRPELLRNRSAMGRPAITTDALWCPAGNAILGFDRSGNPIATDRQIRASSFVPGNLLFVDGVVVSLRQHALDVLTDGLAVQKRIEDRLHASPDDPAAILRLAAMRAATLPADATAAMRQSVTDLYRRGLAASLARGLPPTHPVRQALQQELFDQAEASATSALERRDPQALQLLTEARQSAPDLRAWLRMQLLVLNLLSDRPAQFRTELDRLEAEAGNNTILQADGTAQPVRAFVLWQRARLSDQEPAAATALWQELLENYPEVEFQRRPASQLAQEAIEKLVAAHGPQIYAAIAARALAALEAAGDDAQRLRALSTAFPNSTAANTARMRLLDHSVKAGDLAIACEVLSHDVRSGTGKPGILRRVAVAALARGNRALAAAMADRLLRDHQSEVSDWPEDQGATYAQVVAALQPQLTSAIPAPPLQVPTRVLAMVQPRTVRESFHMPPVVVASGFDQPADRPLYAVGGAELVAIDLHAPGVKKPILWTMPVQFLEHVVLCGTTLVVPDLERLVGVDYRTGAVRWELPGTSGRLLDGLGVQDGVLHVSAQADDPAGGAEFLGIEPSSGAILFSRSLPSDRVKPVPKPVAGQLLAMQTSTNGDAELTRFDPVTGATLATVKIAAKVLQNEAELRPDSLATRVYPQGICADAERIFLPIDSTISGDAPRLLAVDNRGGVVWTWHGLPDCTLRMAALRDKHLVIVEGAEEKAGRISLLRAADGEVLRTTELGIGIDVLNWQRTWLPNPAPAAVLLSDTSVDGRERRLICFGVDDAMPSFLEPLPNEDGEVERFPQFGEGFLTFGVRPAQRGPFRLYALDLSTRKGRMPSGDKSIRPGLRATFGMATVGAYTVIASTDGLWVLGSNETKK
ncbi:MAG: PQQ-binding-like beta-propeller repeat protein [Planctomycetes bacterium]|nr:PQQ-binding-like beta-propeller repeat protein [Planctomycetota bacterium]